VDRIVNAFPTDKQAHVRTMLSTSLRGVISQQLIQRADKRGRVAALEILINTPAVSNLIRQGKLDQLENTMQSGGLQGMRTMDSAIQELLDKGMISGRSAFEKTSTSRVSSSSGTSAGLQAVHGIIRALHANPPPRAR
jgi:twitching motility protein PilT